MGRCACGGVHGVVWMGVHGGRSHPQQLSLDGRFRLDLLCRARVHHVQLLGARLLLRRKMRRGWESRPGWEEEEEEETTRLLLLLLDCLLDYLIDSY